MGNLGVRDVDRQPDGPLPQGRREDHAHHLEAELKPNFQELRQDRRTWPATRQAQMMRKGLAELKHRREGQVQVRTRERRQGGGPQLRHEKRPGQQRHRRPGHEPSVSDSGMTNVGFDMGGIFIEIGLKVDNINQGVRHAPSAAATPALGPSPRDRERNIFYAVIADSKKTKDKAS